MIKELEGLGLTGKEIEVYKALLKLGDVPISEILKVTQDHPQIIYRAIDGLTAQGLVNVTFRQHRKYVRAEDPHLLEKKAENNLAKVRQSIPDLLALQKSSKDAIVRIYKGDEEVRQARFKAYQDIPEGGTYYVISGSGERFYEIMGKYIKVAENLRIKKKIMKKMVTYESQRKPLEEHKLWNKSDFSELRFLSGDLPTPASTVFYCDKVMIYIFTKTPMVIYIESAELVESYKYNFDILWKIAKE